MRSVDRTLRLKEDDLVSDINSVEVFVLSIEVEVYPHGVLDCIDDGGVAFAGKDSTGDFVFGCRKTLLALQFIESKSPVRFLRLTLFPDLDSLCGDDLLIRRGRNRGVGGCGGRGSRKTTGWVGILRLAKWYPEG